MFWRLQENVITDNDLATLVTFIRTTKRFTQHEKVREFEQAFAAWQECRYCVFVNSGSSANLVLVAALKERRGWQAGDEIIVPAVTWPTTLTPVMQLGLKPVFVDANLQDLALDYARLERAITARTRAIFVAHLLGFPADTARIKAVIGKRPIDLLEDCCESLGASSEGSKVGNLGAGGTFSFYWGHHMTTVEGGMICTNDAGLYKQCLLKRSHGLARELPEDCHQAVREQHRGIDFKFLFLTDGFNVRSTEFSAVLGLSQLKRIDEFITIRNRNYQRFLEICRPFAEHLISIKVSGMSSFVLPFLFRRKELRAPFQAAIAGAGIESRPLISGNLLRQPFLRHHYDPTNYRNADFLHDNAFYVGNNQFVDDARLNALQGLMADFFRAV
jgi:CDP-6-deoxy-D-xylo-4-hexulose-3-dehydrase